MENEEEMNAPVAFDPKNPICPKCKIPMEDGVCPVCDMRAIDIEDEDDYYDRRERR